jgi:hypothetical protein
MDIPIRNIEYLILIKEKGEDRELMIFPKQGFIDIDDGFSFDPYDLKTDLVSQRVIKPFKPFVHLSKNGLRILEPIEKAFIKDFKLFFDPIIVIAKEVVYEFFDNYLIPKRKISEAQILSLYESIQCLEKKNTISFCDSNKISEIVKKYRVKMIRYDYKYLIDAKFLYFILKEYLELEISLSR